jgi:hypothetical protein
MHDFQYSGSETALERINGTGPLRSDVYLHVLSVGNLNHPNINYRFMNPIPQQQLPDYQQQRAAAQTTVEQQQQLVQAPASLYWRQLDQWSEVSSTKSVLLIFGCFSRVGFLCFNYKKNVWVLFQLLINYVYVFFKNKHVFVFVKMFMCFLKGNMFLYFTNVKIFMCFSKETCLLKCLCIFQRENMFYS